MNFGIFGGVLQVTWSTLIFLLFNLTQLFYGESWCFCRYVPMFGESQFDPTKQNTSIGEEEQLVALGESVDTGKVVDDFCVLIVVLLLRPHLVK